MTALLLGATGAQGGGLRSGCATRATHSEPCIAGQKKRLTSKRSARTPRCATLSETSPVCLRAPMPSSTRPAPRRRRALKRSGRSTMTRSRRQPISPRRRAGHHQRHWSLCTQSGRPAVSLLAHEARRRRLRHRQRDRLCGPPPREALRRRWSGYHPTCDGVVRHGSARLPRGCGSRDGGRLSGRNLPSSHRHRRRVRSDRGSASQRLMARSRSGTDPTAAVFLTHLPTQSSMCPPAAMTGHRGFHCSGPEVFSAAGSVSVSAGNGQARTDHQQTNDVHRFRVGYVARNALSRTTRQICSAACRATVGCSPGPCIEDVNVD